MSVVDLPESYKDALAGVTGTFKFSANFIALEAFGKVFQPTTLNRGTTYWEDNAELMEQLYNGVLNIRRI